MGAIVRLTHDLKNILQSLDLTARKICLVSRTKPGECNCQSHSLNGSVAAGIERLIDITREIEAVTKAACFDEIDLMPVPLVRDYLFSDVAKSLSRLHQIEIQLESDIAEDGLIVACPKFLRTIVENLVNNAVDAGASKVSLALCEDKTSFAIVVRDNGKGIHPAQIETLGFGFTSKKEGGHGQGIRIIRRLAAELGGTLERPLSIPGFATEMRVKLMKGAAKQAYPASFQKIG